MDDCLVYFSVCYFDCRFSRFYTTFAYVFYVLLILFVVAVMAVGTSVKGQQNWIRIGGFQMQPSELAKFGAALGFVESFFRG
jgi:rod shape determining protein RodA